MKLINKVKCWFLQQWILWVLIALGILVIFYCFVLFAHSIGDLNGVITTGVSEINDPLERGLLYIAMAILGSAIIRAIFNK